LKHVRVLTPYKILFLYIYIYIYCACVGLDKNGKGKGHRITGHEGPGGGGVAVELYSFLNLGARWEWVVNATLRSLYPRERPGGWALGPVWDNKYE
jgi:hypothetical protein